MEATEQYAGKLEGLDWNPASASMRTQVRRFTSLICKVKGSEKKNL